VSVVAYRRGSAGDRAALERMLSGLSADSAYARFQTALGPGPSAAVLDALLPDGVRGGALLGWDGEELVAHGVWVRLGPSRAAEIAIVVTDSHQQQGIGTVLAARLVAAAQERGIERIEVFSETRNRAIARMVTRIAPDAVREREGPTVTYSFGIAVAGRMREGAQVA
jgi:GNAT superfamily N-acetyltransferase